MPSTNNVMSIGKETIGKVGEGHGDDKMWCDLVKKFESI
jgi:hypothetical protein